MAFKSLATSGIINFAKYQNALVGNEAFDPSSDFLITETLISSTTASVTFSSIPQTYKHLQIRAVTRADYGLNNALTLTGTINGDTGSNYIAHQLYGNGSTVASTANTAAGYFSIDYFSPGSTTTANVFGAGIIDILDYSSSVKNKTVRAFSGLVLPVSNQGVRLSSFVWLSTSPITSITVKGADSFLAGSRISLYGSKG